jgi:15-cis-phytoene synthase
VSTEEALQSSYRFCAVLARREARHFFHAFLLLPRSRRRSMCALYAFLRHTDDLADETGSAERKAEAIDSWRIEFDNALEGRECHWPGLPAVADTIARHGIPAHLLHEVIDGVSMDVEPRRYATFADLAEYCHRVASVVGVCCLHVWGYRSEEGRAEKLAEKCGIALQLTNIIRDVRADACNGRIYLPTEDLERFGVAPEDLIATGPAGDRLRALLAFEAQRALEYYKQARELVPLIASVGRPVLLTIIGTYRGLLDEIVNRNYNVMDDRISVSHWRKAAIVLRALAARFTSRDAHQDWDRNRHDTASQPSH